MLSDSARIWVYKCCNAKKHWSRNTHPTSFPLILMSFFAIQMLVWMECHYRMNFFELNAWFSLNVCNKDVQPIISRVLELFVAFACRFGYFHKQQIQISSPKSRIFTLTLLKIRANRIKCLADFPLAKIKSKFAISRRFPAVELWRPLQLRAGVSIPNFIFFFNKNCQVFG